MPPVEPIRGKYQSQQENKKCGQFGNNWPTADVARIKAPDVVERHESQVFGVPGLAPGAAAGAGLAAGVVSSFGLEILMFRLNSFSGVLALSAA